jgi:3-methyladenine DNA glycosylase AlkD
MTEEIQSRLSDLSNPEEARFLQKFFKTGPGQYGQGDLFRGIRVPVLRRLSRSYGDISLEETDRLLQSAYHEDRLLALLILVRKYAGADEKQKSAIYSLYLNRTRFINNWDLVDASAEHIVGAFLKEKSRELLYRLARSTHLWERRIAVLATFHYIKRGELEETFRIAEMLLADREDLIHKAVGWMLREAGKRDLSREETFLALPPEKRLHYLQIR